MTRAERVIEARRKLKAGDFDRAVTSNEPAELRWNLLHLECGHQAAWSPNLVLDSTAPARQTCHKCAQAWIDAAD